MSLKLQFVNMKTKIIVALDGSGDFTTLKSAFDSLQTETKQDEVNKIETEIFVKNGTYFEQVELLCSNVSVIGESVDNTIITYNAGAKEILADGVKRGTFCSSTFRLYGKNIKLANLTIRNDAGIGKIAGQAVALYTDGDDIVVENCKLIAHQDTLFTAPLPPTNIDGSVTGMGPRGFSERTSGYHQFIKCYIEGDIDFIFGGVKALFKDCEIFSNGSGYITAACTPKEQEYGYLFLNCRITGNCGEGTVYLGRPWRNFAKTVYANCKIEAHVNESLWNDWNKPEAHDTTFYAIDNCEFAKKPMNVPEWTHQSASEYVKGFLSNDEL